MGLDRIFGLNHTVVVAVSAVLHVAILVAMYRLLLLLFGNRRAVLGLLVAFGCSTLWLSGYLWWVSALQVLPGILFTVIAIDAFVRHQVFGGPRYALLTAGSLASALLFYEKPLQLLVLLPIIAVLFFSFSDSPAGWWRALQRARSHTIRADRPGRCPGSPLGNLEGASLLRRPTSARRQRSPRVRSP